MTREEQMEKYAADAITERPLRFSVTITAKQGGRVERCALLRFLGFKTKPGTEVRWFEIPRPKLGKIQLLSKLYLDLEISDIDLQDNPISTMMRICAQKVDTCTKMMAIATATTKEEVLDDNFIAERADFFKWAAEEEDMAKVIVALISQSHYANFLSSIALTKIFRLNEPTEVEGTNAVE